MNKDQILNDLAPFADLGTQPPVIAETVGGLIARFVRDAMPIELSIDSSGLISERIAGAERKYSSIRSLLASPSYASLGRWADSQAILLRERVEGETIPIVGVSEGGEEQDVEALDDALGEIQSVSKPRTLITLIDGPAGIGKTSAIRSLTYRRATTFRTTQRSLILHVESRGRMLQNLTDLIAFSLQSLRLSVTYDQIPALVRHGLVTLAIDGFDELGDPSGYELAWAQLNDLVVDSRGAGALILAGRETFISKPRILKALPAIDENRDTVLTYSLLPLQPITAKNWLVAAGWPSEVVSSDVVSPLFERGSYALRPFFLAELARDGVCEQIAGGQVQDLLSFLITAMIQREAKKFGKEVEAITSEEQRQLFVRTLTEEIARDLAENQADSISVEALSWIAEVVGEGIVPISLMGILKNRAGVIAFLTDDIRRGYRSFVHSQVANYFLSIVTVRVIRAREVPKYIRRNIFGSEFLQSFSSVVRYLPIDQIDEFLTAAVDIIDSTDDRDRTRRNLAALVLCVCSVANPTITPILKELSIDEAFMAESVSRVELKSVTIGQLNARSTDFRNVEFDDECFIVTLIADRGTIPPQSIPRPTLVNLVDEYLGSPDEIEVWLGGQYLSTIPAPEAGEMSAAIRSHFVLFELLHRVIRYKPYWIKESEERASKKIIEDDNWETLKQIMLKHDLLVERHDLPTSGRPGVFYHVKNRDSLLDIANPPKHLIPFLKDLVEASMMFSSDSSEG